MKKYLYFVGFLLGLGMALPTSAAGEGSVIGAARLRSSPSTVTGAVQMIMPKGATVQILSKESGWYNISYAGKTGWTVDWLITELPSAVPAATETEARQGEYVGLGRVRSTPSMSGKIITTLPRKTVVTITDQTSGWYKIKSVNGVEGWTADWLITVVTPSMPTTQPSTPAITIPAPAVQAISASSYQSGVVPAGIDVVALNTYWRDKVNALRAASGLRELVLDQRWIDTAAEYAAYMGDTGTMDHSRPDGKSMHRWIDAKGLAFTTRYGDGGWRTNYFSENLSRRTTDGTQAAVERALDQALQFFLAEGPGGAHYDTIYHADWNSLGIGFHFKEVASGQYQTAMVFHYGSLVLP